MQICRGYRSKPLQKRGQAGKQGNAPATASGTGHPSTPQSRHMKIVEDSGYPFYTLEGPPFGDRATPHSEYVTQRDAFCIRCGTSQHNKTGISQDAFRDTLGRWIDRGDGTGEYVTYWPQQRRLHIVIGILNWGTATDARH